MPEYVGYLSLTPRRRQGHADVVPKGRKWWIGGSADEGCQIFIVMGKADPDAESYRQQAMFLVPRDTAGTTYGYPPRTSSPARVTVS